MVQRDWRVTMVVVVMQIWVSVIVYLVLVVLIVVQVERIKNSWSIHRLISDSTLLVKCAGHDHLYCYNGGCPTGGSDSDAQCTCSDPYTGSDCSQMMCSHSAVTCYNGGQCVDGQTCKCPPGYGGIDCRGCTSEKILLT